LRATDFLYPRCLSSSERQKAKQTRLGIITIQKVQ
jgi:hypothetical protein